jgi:hypothetical protein
MREDNRFTYFDNFYNTLNDGIYSVMDIDFNVPILTPVNLLNNEKFESKYELIYLNSKYEKELFHKEGVFKHNSGFYIYLGRFDKESEFKIKIIYKAEIYEQIKIYINGLKKIK